MARIEKAQYTGRGLAREPYFKQISTDSATQQGRMFIGIGDELGEISKTLTKAHNLAEETKAKNYAAKRIADIDLKIKTETEPTPEKLKAYQEEIDRAYKEASNLITNQEARNSYLLKTDAEKYLKKTEAQLSFHDLFKQQAKTELEIREQQLKESYITELDPQKKQMIINDYYQFLDSQAGVYKTQAEVELLKQEKRLEWEKETATNEAYENPELFLQREKNYYDISEKERSELQETAKKVLEKKEKRQREQEIKAHNQQESRIAEAYLQDEDQAYSEIQKAIGINENAKNVVLMSLRQEYAEDGATDSSKFVSLWKKYAEADTEEKVRELRNEIYISKPFLDEANFKELLSLTTEENMIESQKETRGIVRRAIDSIGGYEAGKATGEATQKLFKVLDRLYKDTKDVKTGVLKNGDIITRNGRSYKVIVKGDKTSYEVQS